LVGEVGAGVEMGVSCMKEVKVLAGEVNNTKLVGSTAVLLRGF
jgi:hypothetical protein